MNGKLKRNKVGWSKREKRVVEILITPSSINEKLANVCESGYTVVAKEY